MTRRIEDTDLANARRLKRFYTAKKKALGLTQTAIADALGMKQGAVAQYMNGHIALNYGAVIRFAKLLEVDPWEIDPTLNVLDSKSSDRATTVTVDVKHTLFGEGRPTNTLITIRYDGMSDYLLGFEADDNRLAPFLKEGDVAVVDRSLQPEPGDDIVIKLHGGHVVVGELVKQNARSLTVSTYPDQGEHDRPMDEIEHYDVIVDIHKPHKNRARRVKTA